MGRSQGSGWGPDGNGEPDRTGWDRIDPEGTGWDWIEPGQHWLDWIEPD